MNYLLNYIPNPKWDICKHATSEIGGFIRARRPQTTAHTSNKDKLFTATNSVQRVFTFHNILLATTMSSDTATELQKRPHSPTGSEDEQPAKISRTKSQMPNGKTNGASVSSFVAPVLSNMRSLLMKTSTVPEEGTRNLRVQGLVIPFIPTDIYSGSTARTVRNILKGAFRCPDVLPKAEFPVVESNEESITFKYLSQAGEKWFNDYTSGFSKGTTGNLRTYLRYGTSQSTEVQTMMTKLTAYETENECSLFDTHTIKYGITDQSFLIWSDKKLSDTIDVGNFCSLIGIYVAVYCPDNGTPRPQVTAINCINTHRLATLTDMLAFKSSSSLINCSLDNPTDQILQGSSFSLPKKTDSAGNVTANMGPFLRAAFLRVFADQPKPLCIQQVVIFTNSIARRFGLTAEGWLAFADLLNFISFAIPTTPDVVKTDVHDESGAVVSGAYVNKTESSAAYHDQVAQLGDGNLENLNDDMTCSVASTIFMHPTHVRAMCLKLAPEIAEMLSASETEIASEPVTIDGVEISARDISRLASKYAILPATVTAQKPEYAVYAASNTAFLKDGPRVMFAAESRRKLTSLREYIKAGAEHYITLNDIESLLVYNAKVAKTMTDTVTEFIDQHIPGGMIETSDVISEDAEKRTVINVERMRALLQVGMQLPEWEETNLFAAWTHLSPHVFPISRTDGPASFLFIIDAPGNPREHLQQQRQAEQDKA